MAITIILSDVFNKYGTAPEPLPENTESATLSMKQARALVERFATEDAAVFNFLLFHQPPSNKPGPALSPERIRESFSFYLEQLNKDYRMELSKGHWLSVNAEERSGAQKLKQFCAFVIFALSDRKMLQETESLPSPEIVRSLTEFSKCIEEHTMRYWGFSAREAQLIKDIMLPTNPIDPELADKDSLEDMLEDIYARKLSIETQGRIDRQSKAPYYGPPIKIRRLSGSLRI